ncbi:hypothetical protein Mal15_56690 [Stieleria maiorica]|uniref:BIG2 domain-containing protein n=1 Tax=Stieleria maiorica TaxID=2795974 RepID=A0A5B9MJZ2_9BACT|nr:DUF1549 and DUF1553 domain-containing protein [Stieleria maiorica]QEG01592.1 hypothetical protein Mal15_56690 [Stieleria maiorica]
MRRRIYPFAAIAITVALLGPGNLWAEQLDTSIEKRFGTSAASAPPDFQKHVIPLISRLGCIGRACHGSFQGRGGMSLSLFGYDFQADREALTGKSHSESGHRVDVTNPDQSLILLKATETIGHEGGQRFEPDSWQYGVLRAWIAAGAPREKREQHLDSLEVHPQQLKWNGLQQSAAIRVTAIWSDGTKEDVTGITRFRSNDDATVRIDAEGRAEAVGFGDTHLVAFYDNGVASIPVVVRNPKQPTAPWPIDPEPSPIDQRVNQKLRFLGIVPSQRCDDSEFIRRASIDLTGTLPSPQEVQAFLADPSPHKRSSKIDDLLRRPAMAAWWANKLCDFTGCNPGQQAELGQEFAQQWYMWIYQRLRDNVPYDEIVEGILLARGRDDDESYRDYAEKMSSYFRQDNAGDFADRSTMQHYWSRRSLGESSEKALAVAHSFMGIRLQCAQCHKHPWDQWTQEDFDQFSHFFDDVQYGVRQDAEPVYRELAGNVGLQLRKGQEGAPIRPEQLAYAREGKTIPWREVYLRAREQPKRLSLLGQQSVFLKPDGDPRRAIMDWLRQPENPWFAKAIVNRVWASCFHVGIIDPPDDLNAANPPSNPELLDYLATEFVKRDYDLRWLLAEITNSSAWQRSVRPNATNLNDRKHFSRAIPRRIPAEVAYDAMKQVLCASTQQESVREDLSRRAVGHLSMRMAGTYAMHVFGKPERAVTCDCERVNEPSLLQSVFMQNDPLVLILLGDSGWLAEIREHQQPTTAVQQRWIEEAWLRAFSRPPRSEELERALSHLSSAPSVGEGMEDLLWSLFNTKEFLLNH